MIKYQTIPLVLIMVLLFLFARTASADHAYAGDQAVKEYQPTAEEMIIDGLIYRPLYLAGTAIGLGVFIATLPFSVIGGNADQAGQTLVVEPAKATFGECLGCLPYYSYSR